MECWICGYKENITRHHLKPKRCNGSDHEDNLISICRTCHDVVDTKEIQKNHLELIAGNPKLMSLIFARTIYDYNNARSIARVEQEILISAIKVLENPSDHKQLEKLRGGIKELRTRYKRK